MRVVPHAHIHGRRRYSIVLILNFVAYASYQQPRMQEQPPFASIEKARTTGTWPMTGQFFKLRKCGPADGFSSSAVIYKEVPPRFDKKDGSLASGSCHMSAV